MSVILHWRQQDMFYISAARDDDGSKKVLQLQKPIFVTEINKPSVYSHGKAFYFNTYLRGAKSSQTCEPSRRKNLTIIHLTETVDKNSRIKYYTFSFKG